MIIVGCLIVFECEDTIGKTLRSIERFVDRIIAIDGAYVGKCDYTASKDRTQLKVIGFPKPKILIRPHESHQWRDEMHVRNKYLDPGYVDEGDWLFIIDSDEWISSGVDETLDFLLDSKQPYHDVTRWTPENGKYANAGHRVQLIRYVKGMKYVKNHYTIQYPDGSIMTTASPATRSPLHIVHDQSHWSKKYAEMREKYNREIRPSKEIPTV